MSTSTINTVPLAIAGYNSEHQTFYNEMAAASIISMLPLALFFYLAGKYIGLGLMLIKVVASCKMYLCQS